MAILDQELLYATNDIRQLARGDGVNYAFWPQVREFMDQHGIIDADLQHALEDCSANKVQRFGGIVRYVVEGRDTDDRLLKMTVIPIKELLMIEMVALKL